MLLESEIKTGFEQFNLDDRILDALEHVGYETPTPIQKETIPYMLEGRDLVGQAQTGTGKTAAFALPLLNNIDVTADSPQVLVLCPTRELAIQVAEAFQKYSMNMDNFRVLPVYGGQDIAKQLKHLKRGVHAVVGTPGRIMDHIRRKTLNTANLKCLILDEADEMLRMGFIEDVEWILSHLPEQHQTALFSATMPKEIRKIAQEYLNDPQEITIKTETATVDTINQRFILVSGFRKMDALTRILDTEDFDGMLIFARTRETTRTVAEKLKARGYDAAPLNGDMAQLKREKTVAQFVGGKINVLVATDVAARGLDIDRISHVINYDIPMDIEFYVHRVGRTGRAGKKGEAILLVTPRERAMMRAIEKATNQPMLRMELPSAQAVTDKRVSKFKQEIIDGVDSRADSYKELLEELAAEHELSFLDIAASLANLYRGHKSLWEKEIDVKPAKSGRKDSRESIKEAKERRAAEGMERYRLSIGRAVNVEARNIVGALVNELKIHKRHIGKIDIYEDKSFVDLPLGMPKEIFNKMKRLKINGKRFSVELDNENFSPKPKTHKKKKLMVSRLRKNKKK
ncbi:MAG: ATP-dependent RNA helicase [Candidatus Cloacimonadota bacterium]|nr:MAG: ATP-dependent RNA helicase [Candidatus Cloacimonadota bacterium]